MNKFFLIFFFSISFALFAQEEGNDSLQVKQTVNSYITHTVLKGETLFAISRKYRVSIRNIIKNNNIKKQLIHVNQVLYIKPIEPTEVHDTEVIVEDITETSIVIDEKNVILKDTITTTRIDSTLVIIEPPKAIWVDDYYEAVKQAKEENKVLLLFFTGSDWCGICKMLKTNFFESTKFIDIAKNDLVLYEADFPKRSNYLSEDRENTNWTIKAKYHAHDGVPMVILIDTDEEELGRRFNFGIDADTDYHFELLQSALEKHNSK